MAVSEMASDDYHKLVRDDALELVQGHAGKVLDIGGGVGATSASLKKAGRADHIVLVDLVADRKLPEIDAAFVGDLQDAAFLQQVTQDHGPFDTILCLDVLEHLPDPWSVVGHLHHALSDNGNLIISVPNMRNIQLVLPLVMKGKFELKEEGLLDRTHLRWFVRDTARQLVTCSGLKLDAFWPKVMRGRKYQLLDKLTLGLFRDFLVIQFLARVKK